MSTVESLAAGPRVNRRFNAFTCFFKKKKQCEVRLLRNAEFPSDHVLIRLITHRHLDWLRREVSEV